MAPPPICHSSALIGLHSPRNRSRRCHFSRASSFFRAAPHERGDEVLKWRSGAASRPVSSE
jgi:hypothetical protein